MLWVPFTPVCSYYPSQELEITWRWGGGAPVRSYVNVVAKGEYYIAMAGIVDLASVRKEADMDRIKAIFKTIDLEP
jgi:hypothetical protein